MAKYDEYYSEVARDARILLDLVGRMRTKQTQWNGGDYGNTLPVSANGVTPLQVSAVVFDVTNAIQALFNAGHATNLEHVL